MWKDIIDFIEKVSKEENNEELMAYYLEYVATSNPFKSVRCSPPSKIASDAIGIKRIKKREPTNKVAYEKILQHKFNSDFFKEQVSNWKKHNTGIEGVNKALKDTNKYIEMTFILKSVEKIHRYERMKYIVSTLLAILTLIVSIKVSIFMIG